MKKLRHYSRPVVFTFMAMSMSACIMIPVKRYDTWSSRCNISDQQTLHFAPGRTTRRDLLHQLGEPDAASVDERKLVYIRTQVVAWWMLVGFEGPAASGVDGEIVDADFYVAEFDDRGVLLKFTEAKQFPDMIPALAGYDGHKVLFQKRALQLKPEHVGGELLLTDADIIFISDWQLSNAQPEFRVAYGRISDVRLKMLKTKITVRCHDGRAYDFMIVDGFKGRESLHRAYALIQQQIAP